MSTDHLHELVHRHRVDLYSAVATPFQFRKLAVPATARPPRRRRRFRHAERGLAMLETAILLPLLIGLLAGLIYVGRLGVTALTLGANNRDCAHRIALNGCRSIPTECTASPTESPRSSAEAESERHLRESLARTEASGPTNDAVSSLLSDLFGSSTRVESLDELERPRVLGGGKVAVARGLSMPCAPTPNPPSDVAQATFNGVRGTE